MRVERKTAQFKKTKTTAGKDRRKSVTDRLRARSHRSLSTSLKNKMWHNWLTEENYL